MSDQQDLLVAVYERLGRVDAKLDSYHEETSELRGRVNRLEARWAKLMGMFAIIGLPFTAFASYLKRKTS